MSAALRVLIVDDEPAIRRLLRISLSAHGYTVLEAEDGEAGFGMHQRNTLDVLLLDLGLPRLGGLDVLKKVRANGSHVPVIVLSSHADERTKVAALDAGADDYVVKPFDMDELLARIRAAIRHRLRQQSEKPVFKNGDLTIDFDRRIVTVRGTTVKLTPREFDLLRLLATHCGLALTHDFIMSAVWTNPAEVTLLRIYIRALRQKIEADPGQPKLIQTELGIGYRMRDVD
jgi:two-component system, OmpR family, KDP operon response regulator KdpE